MAPARSANQSPAMLSANTLQSAASLQHLPANQVHPEPYYASFGVQSPDLREMTARVNEANRLATQGPVVTKNVQFLSSHNTSSMITNQEPIPPQRQGQ